MYSGVTSDMREAAGTKDARKVPGREASKSKLDKNAASDTISVSSATTVGAKKVPDIQQIERRNWLIHLHFLRKDYKICKQLIDSQLNETQGMCEYALYIQGLIMRQEGKLQDSLELFQTCTILNSSELENVKQVGRSLYLLGRFKSAAEVYEEAALINAKDWAIWHNLAECYHRLKNLEKAKECCRQALQIAKREETFLLLGRVCTDLQDLLSAMEVYRKALDFFGDSSNIHEAVGLLHLSSGNHHKAFEHLGTALTFSPTSRKALLAVGSIMQKNCDFDVAISKYRPAAALMPDSGPLWNNIGMCFFGRKKYVAAISCLKRALYLAPLEWKILYNLGLVHLTMQQYASSFHFLSAAINLHPTVGQVFMLLAVSLTHLNDPENARLAYEQALELDKTDPIICLNFAIFLSNRGDIPQSQQQLSAFERRMARYCGSSSADLDQEHLEIANQLGVSLAAAVANSTDAQATGDSSQVAKQDANKS